MSLISCSSSPQKNKTHKKSDNNEEVVTQADEKYIAANDLIKEAKQQDVPAANKLLIQASASFLLEEDANKALWLANQLLQNQQTPDDTYQLLLTSAQSSYALEEHTLAFQYLSQLTQLAKQHQMAHTLAYFELSHQVEVTQERTVKALNAYLHAFSLNNESSENDLIYIWQHLTQLSPWQLNQLNNLFAPYVKGWVELADISNKYTDQNEFNFQINVWQKKYTSHPANTILASIQLPDIDSQILSKNIAVILPLSGKQASAGIAAQQGILAAYQSQNSAKLHFIDSQSIEMASLETFIIEQNIEQIIGPLLKSKVDEYLSLTNLTTPTLLLNIPTQHELLPHQVAFSMRPEDEAIQAASILSQKNYQYPMLFSHSDTISQRIANAFIQQWTLLTGNVPEQLIFEQDNKVQKQLKASLSITESQQRINELKSYLRQSIKTERRNRRDIDMIYIVGNPRQTRLLKPYIDVNISPFAELIPVFASSRSHSLTTDDSSLRDLEGLIFTQMPWLLSSNQQNKELATLTRNLWPQRSDTLQRIFAMGFDALQLTNKLPQMQNMSHIRHFGQTGVLKLDTNNVLTRSLLWGKYRRHKVTSVDID
jgi:outer membrane PBP1 activator LpoA protein